MLPHDRIASQPQRRCDPVQTPVHPSSHPQTIAREFNSERAGLVNASVERRLQKTRLLDKYLPFLEGCCPTHLAKHQERRFCGFPCDDEEQYAVSNYMPFRKSFRFERLRYCFHCGIPQSFKQNGEGPLCHAGFTFGRGEKCNFANLIFKTVLLLWAQPIVRAEFTRDLNVIGPIDSYNDFVRWATMEERDRGEYHKCLEVFLWFCQRLEAQKKIFK